MQERFCTQDGAMPDTGTEWGLSVWRVVLQRATWGYWWQQSQQEPAACPGSQEAAAYTIAKWSRELVLPIYVQYIVQPHPEYCVQFCALQYKKDVKALERFQRKATELVKRLEGMSCEEKLKAMGFSWRRGGWQMMSLVSEVCWGGCSSFLPGMQYQETWEWLNGTLGSVQTRDGNVLSREWVTFHAHLCLKG